MTVAELIERLGRADPEALVVCWDGQFFPNVVDAEAFLSPDGAVLIDVPSHGGEVLR